MKIDELRKDVNLKNYNTLRVSSTVQYFFEAKSRKDLIEIYKLAKKENLLITMFGGGSNIAISSKYIKGIIVKNNYIYKKLLKEDNKSSIYLVSSGYPTSKLIYETVDAGLSGLEYHKGLPGTVGGAIYMNSKWLNPPSYFGDNVIAAYLLDENCNVKKIKREYFNFSYDYSILHETKEVLLEVIFKFKKSDKKSLKNKSEKSFIYRKETQPFSVATSGCFFRNISEKEKKLHDLPTTSAGYIIDKCGLKGKSIGGFVISKNHANFIINTKEGKPDDLKKIIDLIKSEVRKKFNINLKEEVVILD